VFKNLAAQKPSPHVIEFGVKQSRPGFSTMHKDWVPHHRYYTGADMQPGLDVDLVLDLHSIDAHDENWDIVIACSVFEHVARPWIAAKEIARVLRPGGLVFIQTHQSFPLHAYPHDFWRFSIESLTLLFADSGLTVVDCAYQYPAQVVSQQDPGGKDHPAFLNVCLIGWKE
jgi:SAM-dependent methyltransferase